MDTNLALNAASKLKEYFWMRDQETITTWKIIESETHVNELFALVVKIAQARERDWPYTNPQQEMTAQARELLKEMGLDWRE